MGMPSTTRREGETEEEADLRGLLWPPRRGRPSLKGSQPTTHLYDKMGGTVVVTGSKTLGEILIVLTDTYGDRKATRLAPAAAVMLINLIDARLEEIR